MSWICKCDRCGLIVNKFPYEGMTIKTTGPNKEEHTRHICPTCSESFYYWINKIDPNDLSLVTARIYRN